MPVDTPKIVAARTPTPTPTPAPTAAAQPPGTTTGVAAIDSVLEIALRRNEAEIATVLRYPSYACEAQRPVQPQPLLCREGQSPGDPLTGIWAAHVEGVLWDATMAPRALTNSLNDADQLFAVFHETRPQVGSFVIGEYGLVLARSGPHGPEYTTLRLTEGQIVGVEHSFPPLNFADPTVEWVLPPPGVVIDNAVQVNNPGDCLNVRAEARLSGAVIACAADGVFLRRTGEVVVADAVSWVAVRTPAGVEGWVSGAYLKR